jgi:DNA modification methylase
VKNIKIEKINLDDLKPYEKNAKIHTKEQLGQIKKSIKKFGMNDPIGIWGKENIIVEGHGRLEALKQLGYNEVPCIRLDHLTDEERKAYTLAHNKLTMNTDFDFDILGEELESIVDIDMSDFGFDLDNLIEEDKETLEDDFDCEPPEEPKSKLGDIYKLGNHRLMCGDSTKAEDVEKLMNGKVSDSFVTDPPYNVNYEGKTKEKLKIQSDEMDSEEFILFLSKAFSNANKHLKNGGAFYIWFASRETLAFYNSCKSVGWEIRQQLVWAKNTMVLGRQDYQWKHEPCIYGWKSGNSHYFTNDRTQTTLLEFDKPVRNAEHPTMKPVSLISKLILNSSKKGNIILDLFGGSGTTLISCEQLNRNCYIMELDPKYVDVIIKRWEDFTGEKAVKMSE